MQQQVVVAHWPVDVTPVAAPVLSPTVQDHDVAHVVEYHDAAVLAQRSQKRLRLLQEPATRQTHLAHAREPVDAERDDKVEVLPGLGDLLGKPPNLAAVQVPRPHNDIEWAVLARHVPRNVPVHNGLAERVVQRCRVVRVDRRDRRFIVVSAKHHVTVLARCRWVLHHKAVQPAKVQELEVRDGALEGPHDTHQRLQQHPRAVRKRTPGVRRRVAPHVVRADDVGKVGQL
ncbi:hypothetical protein, conserved in T. vivax [Trypanosoma vivax Y486]|uniref:Uncharacterized protein n=1 Tax=Trypanosoma vivax (strain Y486) TaxID=1055687 RepID=F9WVB2_TRYVY|nr:hypothetical protein, conserved in T. vivax [Trypanosoma vivax Y486]|eukprot:CCD21519.1 hypothetical protein, conserved in T. vivax [Trypanosoma vivax Y486]